MQLRERDGGSVKEFDAIPGRRILFTGQRFRTGRVQWGKCLKDQPASPLLETDYEVVNVLDTAIFYNSNRRGSSARRLNVCRNSAAATPSVTR